jgi:structural hemagglutinin/hemolysin toxin protein RtxA
MKTVLLVFYVPITHTESVKAAVFAAGGGVVGNYQGCSWQVLGAGQFMPTVGSEPFVGQTGQIETVSEHMVQVMCPAAQIHNIVQALHQTHPYETPAYYYFPVHSTVGED